MLFRSSRRRKNGRVLNADQIAHIQLPPTELEAWQFVLPSKLPAIMLAAHDEALAMRHQCAHSRGDVVSRGRRSNISSSHLTEHRSGITLDQHGVEATSHIVAPQVLERDQVDLAAAHAAIA